MTKKILHALIVLAACGLFVGQAQSSCVKKCGGGAGGVPQCPILVLSSSTESYTVPGTTPTIIEQAWTEYDPTSSWSASGDTTGGWVYDGDTTLFNDFEVTVTGTYYCYDAAGGGTAGTTCSSDGEWYEFAIRTNEIASCSLASGPSLQAGGTRAIPGMSPAYDGTGTALATAQPDWAYMTLSYSHTFDGWSSDNADTTNTSCFAPSVKENAANVGDFALNNVTLTLRPISSACY